MLDKVDNVLRHVCRLVHWTCAVLLPLLLLASLTDAVGVRNNVLDQLPFNFIGDLQRSFTPMADMTPRLYNAVHGREQRRRERRNRLVSGTLNIVDIVRPKESGEKLPEGPPPLDTKCSAYGAEVLADLEDQLQSLFVVQPGIVDFGFIEDTNQDCEPNCAFNNPSSPYGVVTLPLAYTENIVRKLRSDTTPQHIRDNLKEDLSEGMAPSWQLRADEVVMVAGCTPPVNLSRYFGAAGYLYTTFSPDRGNWVNVFASLGDSIGMYSIGQTVGVKNRMNASRPILKEEYDQGHANRNWWDVAAMSATPTHSSPPESVDVPYDSFTVVLMGAMDETIQRVFKAVAKVLQNHGIEEGQSINILPIPGEVFAEQIGLEEKSNYYMMMMRNILPAGQLPMFKKYLQTYPWRAWRLTPRWVWRYGPSSAYPMPTVVPRHLPNGPNESRFQEAFDFLVGQVERRYAPRYAIAHTLGSAAALPLLGVDWGVDCVRQSIDWCNGDNRDVTYIGDYPLNRLDRPGQVLVVVGMNHRQTGLTAYNSIAISDPRQGKGVGAFDDTEMVGTADPYLTGTIHQDRSRFMYVVKFARNCTGLSGCHEIPLLGSILDRNSSRYMVLTNRAYINPFSGVGPDTKDLITYHAMLLTPWDVAQSGLGREMYKRDPHSVEIFNHDQCIESLVGLTQCAKANRDFCCSSFTTWNTDTCWCRQSGKALLDTMPALLRPPMFFALGKACNVAMNLTC